jgi:hypothetical protein
MASEDEEEAGEAQQDEGSPEHKYDRKRFKYQDKQFGHTIFPKVGINRRQFGNKKYSFYTARSNSTKSARDQVRDMPSLQRFGEASTASRRGRRSCFRSSFMFIAGIVGVIGMFINRYHTPVSNLRRILNPRDLVAERVQSLASVLKKGDLVRPLFLRGFEEVGELLNTTQYANLTLEALRDDRVLRGVWKFIDGQAESCESPGSELLLRFAFSFLHDVAASGGDVEVSVRTIGKVVSRCLESEESTKPLWSLLVLAARTAIGRESLAGIARPVAAAIMREEFGPWTFAPMPFFAVWANWGPLGEADERSVCQFLEFAVVHREKWKREQYAMMCIMADGIKCPCMDTDDYKALYQKGDCKRVLQDFKESWLPAKQ